MHQQLGSTTVNVRDLLGLVAQCSDDVPTRVVHEHLRDACQYLATGTRRDYLQELRYARRAAEKIGDPGLRESVDRMLAELLAATETTLSHR